MISINIQKYRGGKEIINSTGLEKTRQVLATGRIKAVVVDLDKCLIRSYAGVPAFWYLIKTKEAKWHDLVSYLSLAIRHRLSHSSLKILVPPFLRLNGLQFQEQSLLFELRTREEIMANAVHASLSTLRKLVRDPLLEICLEAKKTSGVELVMATANSETFAKPLAALLGFDVVLASRLDRIKKKTSSLLVGHGKLKAVEEHLHYRGLKLDEAWLLVDLDYSGNDTAIVQAFRENVSLIVNN